MDQWLSGHQARKHCFTHAFLSHKSQYIDHYKMHLVCILFHNRSSCSYLWLVCNRRRRRESLCLLSLTKCCTVLLDQIVLFCLAPGRCPQRGVPPARPPWTDLRSLQTCGKITRPPSLTRDRVSPQDITQRGGTRSGQ